MHAPRISTLFTLGLLTVAALPGFAADRSFYFLTTGVRADKAWDL